LHVRYIFSHSSYPVSSNLWRHSCSTYVMLTVVFFFVRHWGLNQDGTADASTQYVLCHNVISHIRFVLWFI
jgi:surface polysaccharide O-acyltransferase-like enzyme